MHLRFLTLLIITIFSCGSRTSQVNGEVTDAEDFNEFYEKFTADSLFQVERVEFPFEIMSLDNNDELTIERKQKEDWRFVTFDYKEEYRTRHTDAYTQSMRIYNDSAKLELRGVDNGIFIDFKFLVRSGRWFLVSEKDYSN